MPPAVREDEGNAIEVVQPVEVDGGTARPRRVRVCWGSAPATRSAARRSRVWHTYTPHDLTAKEIEKLDWNELSQGGERRSSTRCGPRSPQKLEPEQRIAANRYFDGSPIYPGKFATDWNRSYILEPDGAPVGAVVLLHGLTDSPYSLRHIARRYREHGYVAVAIRLPAHGTVPAAPDRRRVGGLVGSDPPRRAGGAPPHRPVAAAAPGRVLQRRRARDAVRARRPRRRQALTPARSPRADLADDRHHRDGAVRRGVRLAGGLPAIREGGVAQRDAGVQSVQVQLVPDQRRAAVVAADARRCRTRSRATRARTGSPSCRRS